MKPKKISKKLELNKKTIANLNQENLGSARGGYTPTILWPECKRSDYTCQTYMCNTCQTNCLSCWITDCLCSEPCPTDTEC